jgi:hypothetical protein
MFRFRPSVEALDARTLPSAVLAGPAESSLIGLLRTADEAAHGTGGGGGAGKVSYSDLSVTNPDPGAVGLLVPAVQKVREAAARL